MTKSEDTEEANMRVMMALSGIGEARTAIIALLKSEHIIDPIIREELARAFEGPRDGIYFEINGQSHLKETYELLSQGRKRYFGAIYQAMIEDGDERLTARDRMNAEHNVSDAQADRHRRLLRADIKDAQARLNDDNRLSEWWHSEMFEGHLTVLDLVAVGWDKHEHPWLFILRQSFIDGYR